MKEFDTVRHYISLKSVHCEKSFYRLIRGVPDISGGRGSWLRLKIVGAMSERIPEIEASDMTFDAGAF